LYPPGLFYLLGEYYAVAAADGPGYFTVDLGGLTRVFPQWWY
jgi:hypothetical protein